MESLVHTRQTMASRLLPFWAVFCEDLRQTLRHWALVSWLVLGLLLTLIWFVTMDSERSAASSQQSAVSGQRSAVSGQRSAVSGQQVGQTAAEFGARLLRVHFLLWASFVIVLGASCIVSEVDIAPDAILCRGVSRWQYYLGKCCSRVLAVTGVFLVLTLPAILLGALRLPNDLSFEGLLDVLILGTVFFAALTALGVAGSIWFRSSLMGVAVIWMILYGFGIILSVSNLTNLSPLVLVERFADLLRGSSNLPTHQMLPFLGVAAIISTLVSLVCYCYKDV